MKTTDRAYWAAYMDGEGCVMWQLPPRGSLRVTFTNTHFATLWEGMETFGGNIIETAAGRLRKNTRPTFMWYMYGDTAARFLCCIRPFLKEKRRQVEIAIHMQTVGPVRRQELNRKLKALKHMDSSVQYETWKATE